MGVLSEFVAGLGTVEIFTNQVTEQDIPYRNKKGQDATFSLREQFCVIRTKGQVSGIESVREAQLALPNNAPAYAPGLYCIAGTNLKVSERGRAMFGRDVELVLLPAPVRALLAEDAKRT
jgi:hypothetical protein